MEKSMKKKKPRRRYYTANQIRDEIERYKQKAKSLMESAAKLDAEADKLYRINNPNWNDHAHFTRIQAKQRRQSARRIFDKRLPYLAQKLAEWQTDPMPGIINDRSVQA